MRALFAIALSCGCWSGGPATETLSNTPAAPDSRLLITPTGVGAIDARTRATLPMLQKRLAGFEVREVHGDTLEYDVFAKGERLFYVIPNDDGTIFNVHAVSGKVAVSTHAWRVGEPFHGTNDLTACECWGANPTCYVAGEHVAVNFDVPCVDVVSDVHGRRTLEGTKVQRVIWSPHAFGLEEDSLPPDEPDEP